MAATASFDNAADFADLEDLDLPFEDITDLVFPDFAPQGLLASFGEDADGELYIATFDGNVRRLTFDVQPGDATYDGVVNLADFGILRANFGRSDNPRFQDGDFNGDDLVNLADFGILRANFGTSSQQDLTVMDHWYASVVPEPTAALLAVPAAGLLLRRTRS